MFSVQSKRGTRAITTLHIDTSLSQDELQQDLGLLAHQVRYYIRYNNTISGPHTRRCPGSSGPGTGSSSPSCPGSRRSSLTSSFSSIVSSSFVTNLFSQPGQNISGLCWRIILMNARWVDSMTFLSCRYSTLLLKVNKRCIWIRSLFNLCFQFSAVLSTSCTPTTAR